MNKQSNLYTTIYIVALVLIVGTALATVALSLRSRQQSNIDADKMRQILAAAHIVPEKGQVVEDFNKYVTAQAVYNDRGQIIEGADAFTVDVAEIGRAHV